MRLEVYFHCGSTTRIDAYFLSFVQSRFHLTITSQYRLYDSIHDTSTNTPVASRTTTRSLVDVTNCRCRQVWVSFPSAQ